ncbi:MAG: molecular chaperone TorD family protein [Thermodesulfovibrionales bacterium]|nr:molecular chaperone TorD family protein [Thermodesulfovibrionales bacterium]
MDFQSGREERADIYRFFADLFLRPPDEEMIETLRLYFAVEAKYTPESASPDFENIFRQHPPYESMYDYYGGISPLFEVHAFYESAGLMLDEELGLPADHIGVELLFMSYLVENNRLELQRKFLEGHLLKWAPQYMDKLQKAAESGFYKDMTAIIKNFLLMDYENLSE